MCDKKWGIWCYPSRLAVCGCGGHPVTKYSHYNLLYHDHLLFIFICASFLHTQLQGLRTDLFHAHLLVNTLGYVWFTHCIYHCTGRWNFVCSQKNPLLHDTTWWRYIYREREEVKSIDLFGVIFLLRHWNVFGLDESDIAGFNQVTFEWAQALWMKLRI